MRLLEVFSLCFVRQYWKKSQLFFKKKRTEFQFLQFFVSFSSFPPGLPSRLPSYPPSFLSLFINSYIFSSFFFLDEYKSLRSTHSYLPSRILLVLLSPLSFPLPVSLAHSFISFFLTFCRRWSILFQTLSFSTLSSSLYFRTIKYKVRGSQFCTFCCHLILPAALHQQREM